MQIEIRTEPISLEIYGFSGTAVNRNYASTAFQLMDKMWQVVRSNNIANKGINTWLYEPGEKVFAGVELLEPPAAQIGLERKQITLTKYAWYKHIGPYQLLPQVGQQMRDTLKAEGHRTSFPYVEIYGHWTPDETRLETELLMGLES